MSKPAKIIVGGSFILVFLVIALFFFLRSQVTKSFPITNGTIAVDGLHKPVDVYRDEFGVPHVSAHDEHDLMFTVGYLHAQDRLWQMDVSRRAGEGRLSEIFKEPTLSYDKLFRTFGFSRLADSLALYLHPNSKRMLEDYTDGVNAFIETHRGKYPIEFDMLNYQPEPWKIQHTLLVARLMAWELNFAWWVDLTYDEIAAKVSPQKFQEIIPGYPENTPPIAPQTKAKKSVAAARELLDVVRSYREFFHLGPFTSGSNAWAVDSSKSISGKPLLANDPHLKISVPSKWYEIHLTAPGWNIAGVTIPGAPAVIIGHNDSLAWGLTNAMIDDADFYVEQEDSLKSNQYLFKNSLLPMNVHEETIYIGSSDSITITVRSTRHGPIVNDVHPRREHSSGAMAHPSDPLVLRWTGFEMSDEFNGFYLMDRSTNSIEFEQGVKHLTVPGQSVVYADTRGNIGFWTAARIPICEKRNRTLPLQGWTGEDEWKGFVPFDQLPRSWNPSEGFIISANQSIADKSYPYYLSNLWEPSYRADRIRTLLTSSEKFSLDDFKQFQQDVVSYHSRELTPYILQAFQHDSTEIGSVKAALEYLHNWDFRCTQSDIASTIFNTFFVRLLHNTYDDEMGSDLFNDFVFFSAIPYRVTSQLLAADSSAWFDDVRTDSVETRDVIIRKSLVDAIDELTRSVGPEMKTWQWGKIHQAVFAHLFGERKPLDKVFNVGPFPIGGSASTVNKADFRLMSPYNLFSGPSMRQLIDLAKPASAEMVITLGQSGQPLHDHYDDQTTLWRTGGYHRVTTDWDEIRKSKWEHLELKPSAR